MSTKKSSDKPLVTLDLCGLNCPAPLLGAKHVIDDLRPGQVMQLISDCPGTPDDLFAWSRHTGNEVIATDKPYDFAKRMRNQNQVSDLFFTDSPEKLLREANALAEDVSALPENMSIDLYKSIVVV